MKVTTHLCVLSNVELEAPAAKFKVLYLHYLRILTYNNLS